MTELGLYDERLLSYTEEELNQIAQFNLISIEIWFMIMLVQICLLIDI